MQVEYDDEELNDCVQNIIDCIDEDGNGEITQEEFVEHAFNNEFISNMLGGADG